ncbi:alpha/beta hydrolase [Actinophytocola sp.]|uniref:alpha/beta fold hydrolase n=1 Tax=Actinophytocola sp. TaxID=1872138 RepID=UPI002ED0123E
MTERIADVGRGISLAYEEIGTGEPLVLVAGLGQQLHSWPTAFCEELAARGYRVIRFDNRDAGRSTHMRFRPPRPGAILLRQWPAEQYDLTDMATDTIGLLDALDLADTHIAGVSMGGMIAQTVAALRPERVRTLTSIMSNTGARKAGRPALSTWLLMGGKPARTRAEAEDRAVRIFRHIGSHGFPFDEAAVRELAGSGWDRDPSPAGVGRQLAAIFRSGDRTSRLRAITAPTLVIHGDRDRMVHPTGGAATARAIGGARLETIPGMGHDLPKGAWPRLLDLIDDHARQRSEDATI